MKSFNAEYKLLSSKNPYLGKIAILPWDIEVFHFNVADLQFSPSLNLSKYKKELGTVLTNWSKRNKVALISCVISANDFKKMAILPEIGFRLVDVKITAFYPNLQKIKLPKTRTEIRLAQPKDFEKIEYLAGKGFTFGRYSSDALFPKKLADLRYKMWIHNSLYSPNEGSLVFVLVDSDIVKGFYHVEILKENTADLRLAAIDMNTNSAGLGFELYIGVLKKLKEIGIKKAITSISPANIGVLNIYAGLNFKFSNPQITFHWHSPIYKKLTNNNFTD